MKATAEGGPVPLEPVVGLTDFGRLVRNLRVLHGRSLKLDARELAMRTSELSAIENGRKPVPFDLPQRLAVLYMPPNAEAQATTGPWRTPMDSANEARLSGPLERIVGPDAACKEWWDAVWIGDGENGQRVPEPSDKRYDEYVCGLQIARGAWFAAIDANKVPNSSGRTRRYQPNIGIYEAGIGCRGTKKSDL